MKKIIILCVGLLFSTSPALASKLNLDPYFAIGTSAMEVDFAGKKYTAPTYYLAIGSGLNWISEHLGAELRLGFGGQYGTFDGGINGYTSIFLKPSLSLTRHVDMYALLGATTVAVDLAGIIVNDTSASYGLGFAYHVPNESFSILGEWLQYKKNKDQSTTSVSGMGISGASLSFVFNYY